MTKKQASLLTILSVVSLLLGILICRRVYFRIDLSRNKAYTISPVSRSLYQEIPDQVRLTYYVSDKLLSMHPVPGEVVDFLREYAAQSRGKIRLFVRDPVKEGLVTAMEELGIPGQPIETVERDQASIATVYTGILIEYLDQTEVLPVVFSLSTLEYDLTSRIRALLRDRKREIGVLVGDPGKQWAGDYDYLNQAFSQAGFSLRLLSPGEEIDPAIPAILVLGGAASLDEWDLYRIDYYIHRGGKAIFALEGVNVETRYGLEVNVIVDKGLLAMVSYYGATVVPSLVMDSTALSIPFQVSSPGGGAPQIRMVRYPHWFSVSARYSSESHPVSAGFTSLDLFWPSPLELTPPEGVEASALFSSTPEAWLMTEDFAVDPASAQYLFTREQEATRGQRILAAALTGKFPSWFAGVPKPRREGSAEELPDISGEGRESRILVIGDTDMGSSYIQYTGNQQNLDFFIQAADWLSNDDDIIGIRNRDSLEGRLDKISDPDRRIAAILWARFLNMILLPLVVVIAGFLVSLRRRKSFAAERSANGEVK